MLDLHPDFAALVVILDCVCQQIVKQLLHLAQIGTNREILALFMDCDAARRRLRGNRRQAVLQQFHRADCHNICFRTARFQTGDQNIIHQVRHPHCLFFYAPQKITCRVRILCHAAFQKLDITADRSDRCFQLMRCIAEKLLPDLFFFLDALQIFLHIPGHPRRRVRDDIDLLIRAFFKLKTRVVVIHPHHFAGNFLQRTRD